MIPDNKSIWIGLTMIYGIGRARSRTILDHLGIDFMRKVKDINEEEQKKIMDHLKTLVLENDLKRDVQ